MKKIFLILSTVLLTATFWAQAPQKMSYQAVVRNEAGQLVANAEVRIKVGILNGIEGELLWQEEQMATTNINGLLTIEIGSEVPLFTGMFSNSSTLYLKTEIDPSGGTNYIITGTSQLLSVPYAFHAKNAEIVTGAQADAIIANTEKIGITTELSTKLAGIEEGAQVNIQVDWNQAATDADDFIKNKPDLSGYATKDMASENITNLADPVNKQDAATKAYVDALLERIESLEITTAGLSDSRDGNQYDVVKIGNQIWMAENLRYLPSVIGPATGSETTAYYYVYGYDGTNVNDAKATANYSTYGVLYNWPAAMNAASSSSSNPSGVQGVCPTGWHLPSDAEWTELIAYLGEMGVAGGKLKATTHWMSPNTDATNETGFTALPGGFRIWAETFTDIESHGYWWSATEFSATDAYYRLMYYNLSYVYRAYYTKCLGFSVRCVKD